MIEVNQTGSSDPLTFDVSVSDLAGATRHRVSMRASLFSHLAGDRAATPEEVVAAAFCFMLDREPKEAILGEFDLSVIKRYFPEFDAELPKYLDQRACAGEQHDRGDCG